MTRFSANDAATDGGFTLMELLIALTILSVGLLGVATMQIRSLQVSSYAGDMTAGTTLAQDKLEDLLTQDYTTSALLNAGTTVETSGVFTITTTTVDGTPVPNTKTITVVVNWNDRGVNKTSRLVGVKANI
jgi:type IV pilus assembly protein PilV